MASSSKLQLFSLATPNGQKVAIALEELEVEYDAHTINISKGDQFTDDFKHVNPNSKIPAITDPDGPDGQPISVFESGAILLYLSEKHKKLLPADPRLRIAAIQWLFWQMGGVGPMFGQYNHFTKYAPEKIEYGIKRYGTEAKRLLGVLEVQLGGKEHLIGSDYTIADIAIFPWVRSLLSNTAEQLAEVGIVAADLPNTTAWLERVGARPAVQKGLTVTSFS